ncbi:MAG: hypothetical protein ACI837_001133 [Crocinitomicaceae bacterium]|jgi:hypothetical protein
MTKKFSIFLCLFLPAIGFSQWEDVELSEFADAILAVEERIPDASSYSYEAKYLLYEELTGVDPKMTFDFDMTYNKTAGLMNMSQFGKLVVQNMKIQITVDTAENMIIVNQPEMSYFTKKAASDFDMLLKSQCTAKRKITTSNEIYSLEFAPGARYRGAEIWIQKNGMVNKFILYSGVDLLDDSEKEDKIVHPRMEVRYDKYVIGKNAETKELLNPTNFFSDLTNLTPTVIYKDYEIIDLRN